MTQPTFANLFPASATGNGVTAQDVMNKILECLAILVSGQNPDGTVNAIGSVVPTAANILDGQVSFAASTGATTIITIPAGRTWQGVLAVSCAVDNAGANAVEGFALAQITTAGAGVTPPAGTTFNISAKAGANVAAGTVGSQGNNAAVVPVTVVAPIGNAVTIQGASSITGSVGRVDIAAIGALVA